MSFPGYILYFNIMADNQYIKVSTLDVDREIHLYEILSMNQSVHEVCGQKILNQRKIRLYEFINEPELYH